MFTVYSLFALVCVDHTCWFGTFRQTQFVCQNYDSYQTHIATSCALQSRLSKSPRQNAHSYYRCALSFKSFAMLLRFKVLNAGARLVVTRLKPNGKLCLDKHHSVFVLLRSSTHIIIEQHSTISTWICTSIRCVERTCFSETNYFLLSLVSYPLGIYFCF